MKLLYIFCSILFLSGCSQNKSLLKIRDTNNTQQLKEKKIEVVEDLIDFNQNVEAYIPESLQERYISSLEEYEANYFMPWNIKKITISLEDAKWAYRAFSPKNSYGENLQPLQESFFQDIYSRSNFKDFATLNQKAITLKAINIRAFPTDKPLFMNPNKAGEGFPFDYLQNSLIAPNKPVLVSHYSKDKEWVFIQSSFTYGWVKAHDIVYIPIKYTKLYKEAQKEFLIQEGSAIYDENGNFLFRSRIGMLLPEINATQENFTVLTISNYKNRQAYYMKSKLSKNIAHKGILLFNKKNIIRIFKEVSKVKYGWGGMYGQRDCSSILRDFYAPFGIWLPRNSSKQSKVGRVISFKNLSNDEKIYLIKKEAIPFETLLYKKGHILLYVGIKKGKIVVFHNAWGIKTKKNSKEGRFIIGKPIFSTLEVGSNLKNYDKDASILTQLKSMNILTQ